MTTESLAVSPGGALRRPQPRGLLFVLSANMLMDALEISVVIVAIPAIGADLHLGTSALQWLLSGFALGFGGLLLFGGRVVAQLGRRRVFLTALLVFALASLVGALATEGWLLIATRFVKGFCVALTASTGLAIIAGTFQEGPARNRALATYSLFGASGFSVGLVLSGLLTELSWRWTFLFPVPVALALFVFGLRLIPRDEPRVAGGRHYDLAGASTFVGAALLLVYAIATGPETGWGSPRILGAFALAAALVAATILIERTTTRPLLSMRVFAHRPLLRSALGAAALNGSYWGFLLICTVQLQGSLGWSSLPVALALLPASMLLTLAVPYSGRMVARFSTARLIAVGAAAPPLGYLLWLVAGTPSHYLIDVLPTMVLVGLGFALAFAALHIQATAGLDRTEHAAAAGMYQTAVQIGGAVTVALVAALLVTGDQPGGVPDHRPALLLITAVGAAGFLVALTGVPHPTSRRTRADAVGRKESP